jgi:predicted O-methyltransferase YrrM
MTTLGQKVLREISRPFRRKQRIKQPPTLAAPQPPASNFLAQFDPQSCTVEAEGLALLIELIKESSRYPGPIVEIGTLIGITATHMALAKQAQQKIITVDNYCWNPWDLPPDAHHALAKTILHYLIQTGHIQQVRMDKAEFFATYRGDSPSLVFLDAWHTYDETKKDIEWARSIGAKLIAGHDYSDRFSGVMQVVDEFGGPARLGGTVWVLPLDSKRSERCAA